MAKLRPFRDYSEHDVINLYAFDGVSAQRGDIVKLTATKGWVNGKDWKLDSSESMLNFALGNVVSERHSLKSRVEHADSGDYAVGMLLYDVSETDENGEKLLYNPRKAVEMQTVVSGQAVPVVTDGLFLVNGITNPTLADAGSTAWAIDDGQIAALPVGLEGTARKIGKFMGAVATGGDVLLKLEL